MRAFIGHFQDKCGLVRRNTPAIPTHYHSLRAPRTLKPIFLNHALDHDRIKLNRDLGLAFCWSMILFRKPVPSFRDHALGSMLERHRGLCARTNGGCKMARELAGVIARAVDQGRLAPPQERS